MFVISTAHSCLPNPFFGYSPGYGGYYAPQAAYNNFGPYPRMGPFRAEPQRGPSATAGGATAVAQSPVQSGFAMQQDEIKSVSTLNCASFADKCRWSNTQEEELDWTTLSESPQAAAYLPTLDVQNLPSQSAGSLTSPARNGWESGQLISDALPCLTTGLKITATAWRSKVGPTSEQPKLQVCVRNSNEEKFPLINCNEFEIRNGVPISTDIPTPNDPNSPTQIVFSGNNFIAKEGGALFIQDIVIEGALKCNGETLDSHPVLISNSPTRVNGDEKRSFSENVGSLKGIEGVPGLEAINAGLPANLDEQRIAIAALQKSLAGNSVVDQQPRSPMEMQQAIAVAPQSPPLVQQSQQSPEESLSLTPSLFESCLALSCNPSDLSCKFWRSSGNNRWEIGTAGRVANPLTGINLPPGTAQKFLVAPFFDTHISSYTLVSESLNVPLLEEVYFCFYEYYATEGLSVAVCTDKMDCFYKKNNLSMGDSLRENKKWNIRCAKLPPGSYELRVIAENAGENKGEVGFLPIRLARDPKGQQLIC
uniref:MAM domain-containing protein n=1 Tax=Caenorhabditis japonica TaxID=281687 RepID=A0A8R1DR47_CAEJA